MSKKNKLKGGTSHNTNLNDYLTYSESWCDGHQSQCHDIGWKTSCQSQNGGMEPQVNTSWCDGHHSQCMDSYNNTQCQKGGSNAKKTQEYYKKKYKKYKNKYKLKIN